MELKSVPEKNPWKQERYCIILYNSYNVYRGGMAWPSIT